MFPGNAELPTARRSVPTTATNHSTCIVVREILDRVGDKWSVLVISLLGERGHRFGELRRAIEGISQRMLTLTLRQLERDGLVSRTVHATVPPRVDYALTPLGQSVLEPITGAHAVGRGARHRHRRSPRPVRRRAARSRAAG